MFKLFIQAVGMETALLLAILAAATGVYIAFQNGGLKGAPWADALLKAATGLSKGVSTYSTDLIYGLKDERDAFNLYTTEQEKKLEAANKLLETRNFLSPFVNFGETPDQYYSRSLSGNPGVLGLSAISSYVDVALTLPKRPEFLES